MSNQEEPGTASLHGQHLKVVHRIHDLLQERDELATRPVSEGDEARIKEMVDLKLKSKSKGPEKKRKDESGGLWVGAAA